MGLHLNFKVTLKYEEYMIWIGPRNNEMIILIHKVFCLFVQFHQ